MGVTMQEQQPERPQPNDLPILPIKPPFMSKGQVALLVSVAVILIAGLGAAWYYLSPSSTVNNQTSNQNTAPTSPQTGEQQPAAAISTVTLDPDHNYGDKYANGLLPVGDNMYMTNGAKKGSVYMCNANFVPASQAGAQTRGPWFTNNNTQWDLNKKAHIQGAVSWEQKITITLKDGKRVIVTNDLPDHKTGDFPVGSSDPARKYDANPNTIKEQSLTYTLAGNPTPSSPHCMGGEVGVMVSGVALFNGFDAGGRDAGAWEVQDSCDGHPQSAGEYHYHTLSSCIKDTSVHAVIGYALDGFPITGPKVGDKNYVTTTDLDECHGLISDITLDGKTVKMYHYVMTQDFPYSVSCFRATAVQPPGQHEGQQQPPQGTQPPPKP